MSVGLFFQVDKILTYKQLTDDVHTDMTMDDVRDIDVM
jgi:hypothetical protein